MTDPTYVWSGYDDDKRGFPVFATREAAQAYAEQQFRKDCANWGNPPEDIGEITWIERKAYTDAHDGRAGLFDLTCEIGGDGWAVCELSVHETAADAILAETADAVPLGSRVRIDRPGGPYDRMAGLVTVLHPYDEPGKVGVMVDGREGVAVFPADDVIVLPRAVSLVPATVEAPARPPIDVTVGTPVQIWYEFPDPFTGQISNRRVPCTIVKIDGDWFRVRPNRFSRGSIGNEFTFRADTFEAHHDNFGWHVEAVAR